MTAADHLTEASIRTWLVGTLARRLGIAAGKIDASQPFTEIGLDSMELVALSAELSSFVRKALPETLVWDYPTVDALAHHLASMCAGEGK
jgi:acyl carrier protein